MARAPAADRGDGVQCRLRQSVPLSGVLGQPLRGQGLLPAEPALSRRRAGRRRRLARRLHPGGASPRAARDHGSRRQPHLQGQRARRRSPRMVRPRPRRRDRLALCHRSRRSDPQDRLGRPRRARLPAAAARSDHGLFPGCRAPLPGPRLRRLPLRCGLQGAGRGVVPPDRRRQGDRARCGVFGRDRRRAERGGAGARRCRLRLPLQQRQMVGFREPVAARSVRSLSPYRAVDRFPREPRHRAAGERIARRRHSRQRDRATLSPSLCLRRGVFDWRADADGVRIRLGAAIGGGHGRRCGARNEALRPQRLHCRGQRVETGDPGFERGRSATLAAKPTTPIW